MQRNTRPHYRQHHCYSIVKCTPILLTFLKGEKPKMKLDFVCLVYFVLFWFFFPCTYSTYQMSALLFVSPVPGQPFPWTAWTLHYSMLYYSTFLHEQFVQQSSLDATILFSCNVSLQRPLSSNTILAHKQINAHYTRGCWNTLPLHTLAILECFVSAPLEYSCNVNIKRSQFQNIPMMLTSKQMNQTLHDISDIWSRIMIPAGISQHSSVFIPSGFRVFNWNVQ